MKNLKSLIFCFFSLAFMSQIAFAQDDWPNLKAYRDADAELEAPVKGNNRVVFMGNSITIGWKTADPEFFETNGYINRGISGQTTPQMLIRFRQDVIHLHPRVVVILAGTNDIAGNTGPSTLEMIEDNLASMAELANANHIKVVLSSVLPAYDYPWRKGLEPAPKIIKLNEWIKNYAAKKGFVYLNYYPHLADEKGGMRPEFSKDGVHPNLAGYKVMEPLVQEAISKALKSKPKKN